MFGSILGAVTSLAGGLLGSNSADSATRANTASSEADRAFQKEVAQQGIRWRVDDARAAKISPLAALGAQLMSPSPTAISAAPDNSMGDAIGRAGQDLSRAIDSTSTAPERAGVLHNLAVDRARLQNEFLRTQIAGSKLAVMKQAGGTPPSPTLINPSEIDYTLPGAQQAGAIPEWQLGAPSRSGGQSLQMSKAMKERTEDDMIATGLWHIKNRIFAPRHANPDMYWNPITQSYHRNPIPRRFRVLP